LATKPSQNWHLQATMTAPWVIEYSGTPPLFEC
jgi:hypothetical protein